jgi:hypothetical protein
LKSTFDKISHERKNLSSELGDSKEYCYKLEIQISRMENSSQLLLETENLKAEVRHLHQLLEQKQVDVEIFEQKHHQLEQEKSSLAHSLEACLSYQQQVSSHLVATSHSSPAQNSKGRSSHSHSPYPQEMATLASLSSPHFQASPSPSPPSFSSDKMRNIYHELGKRQSDIHALSLALAQTTAEKKSLQEENASLKGTLKAQAEDLGRLRQETDRVMEVSLRDADEKSESKRLAIASCS